mmetsp:Transcript_23534/g.57648  ORF Transcript_23534/g.57648 Transcript_23534/m.57648 type:complete len:239 (-) Transcript_23534:333-1049(-)
MGRTLDVEARRRALRRGGLRVQVQVCQLQQLRHGQHRVVAVLLRVVHLAGAAGERNHQLLRRLVQPPARHHAHLELHVHHLGVDHEAIRGAIDGIHALHERLQVLPLTLALDDGLPEVREHPQVHVPLAADELVWAERGDALRVRKRQPRRPGAHVVHGVRQAVGQPRGVLGHRVVRRGHEAVAHVHGGHLKLHVVMEHHHGQEGERGDARHERQVQRDQRPVRGLHQLDGLIRERLT